jgi:hypothetical protein
MLILLFGTEKKLLKINKYWQTKTFRNILTTHSHVNSHDSISTNEYVLIIFYCFFSDFSPLFSLRSDAFHVSQFPWHFAHFPAFVFWLLDERMRWYLFFSRVLYSAPLISNIDSSFQVKFSFSPFSSLICFSPYFSKTLQILDVKLFSWCIFRNAIKKTRKYEE